MRSLKVGDVVVLRAGGTKHYSHRLWGTPFKGKIIHIIDDDVMKLRVITPHPHNGYVEDSTVVVFSNAWVLAEKEKTGFGVFITRVAPL